MFTNTSAHAAIDSIQSFKKNAVSKIPHEGISKTLNSFVDAQTAYTKAAVDAGIMCASTLALIIGDKKFFEYMNKNPWFK